MNPATRSQRRPVSVRRLVAVNLLVLVGLLVAIEVAARITVFVLRGSATAGLPERTLYLNYEPFVMFGPGWDEQLPHGPASEPTALLVGGSTAQGFAPEILAAALGRRFGRTIRVVNAAYGGYEARQEAVVASLWAPQLSPSIVISIDGHNDLEHRLRVRRPGRFFLDASYDAILTHPFAAPLVWLLAESQAYNAIARAAARRRVGEWSQYADAIPVYVSAQHSINVVARGLGATRLMVLQPFMAFKEPLAPEERAFTAYAYREPVLLALYDAAAPALAQLAARDGIAFLDARPIFNGTAPAVFTDDVHFRDTRGYEVLARAIADALPANALTAGAR